MTTKQPAAPGRRVRAGDAVEPFEVTSLQGEVVRVTDPAARATHLQFRRFAGCPVCNLHLRSFARRHDALREAGVREVAFFHSTAETMRPYQGDLPFAVVPDPEKVFYRRFGVEQSLRSVLDPRSWGAMAAGMVKNPTNPLSGEGGHLGLPADVLVSPEGRVLAAHYGAHADDQWSVDELLAKLP